MSQELQTRTGHGLPSAADAGPLSLPPEVTLADGLDEREAVAIALWKSPEFAATLADLGLARAELAEAGLLKDPILSFLFPFGPKQYEWTLSLPIEFLWQRPLRIAVARLDLERTANELVRHGLDLVLEARLACVEAALAHQRAQTAEEQGELARELERIEERRLETGDAGPAELELARLRSSRAVIEAQRLVAEAHAARLALEAVLGMDIAAETAIRCDLTDRGLPEECSEEDLLTAALTARPEVRAAELAVEAAAEGVGLARAEAWKLSLVVDANEKGSEGFEVGPGLALPLPVLSGARGTSAKTEARLEQAVRSRLATGARVRAEVRAAHARYESCLARLQEHCERVEPEARRLLDLGQRARSLGASAPSEWGEVQLAALAARRDGLELEAHCRRARALLERSVGCRLEQLPSPAGEAPEEHAP